MPTLAAPLDFSKLEGRNVRIHQLSTAPSSPVEGQEYYNTTDHTFYWWNGTAWRSADASSGVGGPPTGTAGGDLSGSYPNPSVAALAITDAKVATANKDGTAGTPSMRTLGTGATQAAAGNAAPNAHHATHDAGGSDAMVIDAAAATGSLRTLGSGSAQAMPGNRTLDAISAPVADVSLNTHKITGLVDPASPQDAATKNYVDTFAQGLDSHPSVHASTIGSNITLAGSAPNTLDGVTLAGNDRVLVKDQTTPSQNGLYVVTTLGTGANGTWTRATDQNIWSEFPSAYVWVESGTVNADTGWTCTSDAGGTLGTTAVTWVQFASAGSAIAGAGLTKTGNTIDVVGTANRITANADNIDIASTYVGQSSITTLGSIATGTWSATATPIAIASGGTQGITATAARANLGVPTYYTALNAGGGTTFSIPQSTHGMVTTSRAILVQVMVEATGAVILPDVTVGVSPSDVTITFAASQTSNTIRAVLLGLQSTGQPA